MLFRSLVSLGVVKGVRKTTTGKDIWQPPPHGFLKINIDGASKGNPGMDGFGSAIRDEQGHIKDIFHSHLGTATNNMALEQCLEILMESNLHNAIIEVDPELVINVAKKMCNGIAPRKVSKHWRLSQIFQHIHSHLRTLRTVSFIHV